MTGAIKIFFKVLCPTAPRFAAALVHRLTSKPRRRSLRENEVSVVESARKEKVEFKDFSIQTYHWGEGQERKIFLVHGWEGRAGNFGGLVDILIQKGYHIIGFDGPGHGESSPGRTNMLEFSAFVSQMLREHTPENIISHSFGSITTLHALRRMPEIEIQKWMVLTTPYDFFEWVEGVRKSLGLTKKVIEIFVSRIEKETGFNAESLNIGTLAKGVKHVRKAYFYHSQDDKIIPIRDTIRAHEAFPGSEMKVLDGLGHYRILWSEEVKSGIRNTF